MRLIDVDALWERLDYEPWYDNADRDEIALPIVNAAPTVDAEVVTRCKDCKHYLIADEFKGGKRYMCEVNHFSYLNSDGDMHFCSYGEPKEGDHA